MVRGVWKKAGSVGVLVAFLMANGRNGRSAIRPPTAHEVEIVGRDYAFTAPRELPAGETTFRFTNSGKVIHELDVALLKGSTTAQSVMSALNAKTPLKPLIERSVGILIARPGRRSSVGLATELLEGRDYLVICRFQDSASAPMHSRMGMISVIHVTPGRTAVPRSVGVDTIVGIDYAYRAPRTLGAGSHTFTFVNAGTVDHEVNIALLRSGATLEQVFTIAKANGDLNSLVAEWLGVLVARPGTRALGELHAKLLPGREYAIMCELTDNDKSPSHLTLGMFGSIRTTKAIRANR